MALSNTRLAAAIVVRLKTLNPEITGVNETELEEAWRVIADEIIKEFQTFGVVTVTGGLTGNIS